MTYTIYMHTCPNNKVYIGCTQQTLEQRFGKNGEGYSRQRDNKATPPFGLAVLQFGWENIKHEILATTEDRTEASKLEQHYINLYDATNPEKGYNRYKGGIGAPMSSLRPETIEYLKQQRSGRVCIHKDGNNKYVKPDEVQAYLDKGWLKGGEPRPEYIKECVRQANTGRKASPELRARLSECHKGFRHTDEAKAKMSQNTKGKNLGKKHLNKDGVHIAVPADEVNNYLVDGWKLGIGYRKPRGSKTTEELKAKYKNVIVPNTQAEHQEKSELS